MAEEEAELAVDFDDLTFREQLELRSIVRDAGEDVDDPPIALVIPAAIFLIRRRAEPDFTLDQALELKWEDAQKRPTKARKTRATSGAQPTSS